MKNKKRFFRKLAVYLTSVLLLSSVLFVSTPQPTEAKYSNYFMKLAWLLINKSGNSWYSYSATYSPGSMKDFSSSGSKAFNSSKHGASIKHTIKYQEKTDQIDLYAQTSPVNWPGKISIILTNPSGRDVVSKTVTHNQHAFYKGGSIGTYTVRYVQNSKQTWNTWIGYSHYENYRDCSGYSEGNEPTYVPCSTNENIRLYDQDGKTYEAEMIKGSPYIIPSDKHLNPSSTSLNRILDYKQLEAQTFDVNLNTDVYNFKDFGINDELIFEDKIKSLNYNLGDDETYIGFENQDGDITEWLFKGDFTNRFKINDSLKLKFKIVIMEDGHKNYETLDYFKYGMENNSEAPSIDNYIQ